MGTRSDVSELLSAARWSEEGFYLGEIAKTGFPTLVKVTRGQYQNVGQPSFSNPSLHSHLLLVSAGKTLSVAAQCVKFKNQRSRVVPFGPTLAIPSTFDGHFEILSEDGRSVPCITSVEGLLSKFPDSCLVREPIKGLKPVPAISSASDVDVGLISEKIPGRDDSVRISDKSRLIPVGEVLVLLGEVCVPCGKNKVNRYLSCFDSKGQTVYLSVGQKGKFSPLAREESISGVHTTKNILTKRMPLMVRLVDGPAPLSSALTKTASSFKFLPELRLFSILQEELIFAMPLSQCSKDPPAILPLPLSVPLKFQVCRNMETIEPMKEFCRTLEKIQALVALTKDLIQIYDINMKKELRFDGRQWKSYAPPLFLSSEALVSLCPNANHGDGYEVPELQDYEDIDEIYDYVRGIKPSAHIPARLLHHHPEKKVTAIKKSKDSSTYAAIPSKSGSGHSGQPPELAHAQPSAPIRIEDRPPEPPPIETIPTNRNRIIIGGNNNKDILRANNHKNGGGLRKPVILTKELNSTGNSPNNTTTSGSSGGGLSVSGNLIKAGKHLYVKKQHSSSPPHAHAQVTVGSVSGDKVPGIISGSPSNRLVFRRSPIFDCRYKSMNDLNRSSLESGASSGGSKIRHFQHNHPLPGSVNGSNYQQLLNGGHGGKSERNKHHGLLFRPKSLTSLLLPSFEDKGSSRKIEQFGRDTHHHAIHHHSSSPVVIDIVQGRNQRSRHRNSFPSPAALFQ